MSKIGNKRWARRLVRYLKLYFTARLLGIPVPTAPQMDPSGHHVAELQSLVEAKLSQGDHS